VSPRGDEAVYVRSWYDHAQPGRRSAIWRIDGATGRAEPLEPGEPDGRLPTYSPDGRWLAFLSDRPAEHEWRKLPIPPYSDGPGLVWAMPRPLPADPSLGRIVQLSDETDTAVSDTFYTRITFSPDNRWIAYVSGLDRSMKWRVDDELRGRYEIETDDQGEGYEGYLPTAIHFQTGFAANKEDRQQSFSTDRWSPYWYGDPQWSPDSKYVVVHSNRTSDQESVRYSINKNYDLWRIPAEPQGAHDAPQQLTTNPGPDVSPRISPDGKHVLYLSVPRKGPHMDVFNLCVLGLDAKDAKPRTLINAHDAERADDGTPPFQPTFPLRDDCWIDDSHVRVRGVRGMKTETLVFHIAGEDHPIAAHAKPEPDPPANKKLKPPAVNAWLKERLEAREEIVKWKSFDGLEIEGVLTLPPNTDGKDHAPYPLIVYPHGGPHSASKPGFNFTVHLFAAHGYAVFQPNFRGTYGYGRKFLDAARFDMGGSDMQDILTGIDMLIERGTVDKNRQFVYGISYGGYSTCRLVTLTKQFRAAAAQNAVTDLHAMWSLSDLQSWTEWEFGGKPWETVEHEGRKIDVGALMRERSPTTLAHTVTTPTLILHADH
ncbi:MAG: S9 family peptidase, partial [Planctomycetales bacterium]|nr:S9 family peptidase [Planctomycetales bacterium]